jgi:hypothetical protein
MNVEMLEADREEAMAKYREYRTALKLEKTREISRLATIYWQLSRGRKVIDADAAIANAGPNEQGAPKLAIAEAHRTEVNFYTGGSQLIFYHERDCHPVLHTPRPQTWPNKHLRLKAPTPLIPPACHPPNLQLENLHILWEVEKWEPVAPRDPFLLKRLGGPFYVILSAWDLTDVERAVMNAGLRM